MFKFTIGREPGGERADGREFAGLPTWRWTPAAAGSYLLVVAVEARDVANRVLDTGSASIRGYAVGINLTVAPGAVVRLFLANPYALEVHPPSFGDSSRRTGGGPLGGIQQGPQRVPPASPETLIKLEARLRPGLDGTPRRPAALRLRGGRRRRQARLQQGEQMRARRDPPGGGNVHVASRVR
jgi:hypothetical protein